MILATIVLICVSLFLLASFKNFLIQLLSLKLLVDALVLATSSFRGPTQLPFSAQAEAILIASLGATILFIVSVTGIPLFSRIENLKMDSNDE